MYTYVTTDTNDNDEKKEGAAAASGSGESENKIDKSVVEMSALLRVVNINLQVYTTHRSTHSILQNLCGIRNHDC